jgi:hypothetical protein
MTIEPITFLISILTLAVIWQAWILRSVQEDLDEVIDSHNRFVDAITNAMEGPRDV